jgi:uncharacterized protein YndB with AHSA1/START domain
MSDTERGYTIVRTFDATPDMVWSAWATPEHFAAWWGGADMRVEGVALDVRVGGEWRARMVLPNGLDIPWTGTYHEVVEPERLVLDLDDGTGGPGDGRELFTVTIAPTDDGRSEMTLTQSGGHLSDEEYERARIGTNSFLDAMEALFRETIKGRHENA